MASTKSFLFILLSGAAVVALSQATACSSSKSSTSSNGTGASGTGASGTGGGAGGASTSCPPALDPPSDGQSCAASQAGLVCSFGDEPTFDCTCTKSGATQVWKCGGCSGTCTTGPGGGMGGASATGTGGAGGKGTGGAGGKGAGGGA